MNIAKTLKDSLKSLIAGGMQRKITQLQKGLKSPIPRKYSFYSPLKIPQRIKDPILR